MAEYKFDDQIGSRDCRHINILAVPGAGIVEFVGTSISPICRVLKEEYTKQGKWSHHTWTVELSQGAIGAKFSQDFGVGTYFPTRTWEESADRVLSALRHPEGVTREMAERFIRFAFPKVSDRLDYAQEQWAKGGDQFADLLKAQEEHASAAAEVQEVVAQMEATEEAKRLREQATKLREVAQKGRSGTMSLAELKLVLS